MATRIEEIGFLTSIQKSIRKIKALRGREATEYKKIEHQYNRKECFYFPDYVPENNAIKVVDNIDDKKKIPRLILTIALMIPSIILGIYDVIYYQNTGDEGLFDLIVFGLMFFVPIAASIIPYVGFALSALVHLLIGGFWAIGLSMADEMSDVNYVLYRDTFLISAAVLAISLVVWWIAYLIIRAIIEGVYKKKLKAARRLDVQHKEEYEHQKALAEEEHKNKERILAGEVAVNVTAIREEIKSIQDEIRKEEEYLAQLPGLALQDKNEYTVNKLLLYFERGKADSIKEAINLYDAEEREIARDNDARSAAARAAGQRQFMYDQMLENQREHNRKIEERAQRESEKIDKVLDDLKYNR